MISGLIPALPAIIFVPAMIIERLTSKNKIPPSKIMGSFFAIFGIFLLFYQDIITVQISHLYGFLLVFISIFFTLGGTQIAKMLINQQKLPVFWLTSRTLFVGGCLFLFPIFLGKRISCTG